jgi:dihydrofolate reductase
VARLSYTAIMSLDGFVADEKGKWDWAQPDEEVHSFVNDLERPVGIHLYGRRLYEVMRAWEDPSLVAGQPRFMHDYAELWRAADKVVYSTTLEAVSTARTRIERTFEPDAVRNLKESEAREISVGGSDLAGQAIEAGLVDVFHFFVAPAVVGGGKRALPDRVRLDLRLVGEHRFRSGFVHLHYRSA